ncbi:hypothetical protein [Nocardioides convexus]|uniref:hypothetical protein n=1 Tax=Nocardioides convexus TaxID=2712224 RepID=UPI0024182E30|nr:hypothetical protein [Nocardioides convexus]
MHRAPRLLGDPADLVGDGALVGVDAEARLATGDPQRLEGPQPGGGAGRLGVRRQAGRGAPGRSGPGARPPRGPRSRR